MGCGCAESLFASFPSVLHTEKSQLDIRLQCLHLNTSSMNALKTIDILKVIVETSDTKTPL